MVTLVLIWRSPGPGVSGIPLGLNHIWCLWSSTGPHWDLVIMLPTCAPSGPGDAGSIWASSGRGYSIPSGTDLIVVTLVLTLASSVPCDSGSPWTSPVSGDSEYKLGLT